MATVVVGGSPVEGPAADPNPLNPTTPIIAQPGYDAFGQKIVSPMSPLQRRRAAAAAADQPPGTGMINTPAPSLDPNGIRGYTPTTLGQYQPIDSEEATYRGYDPTEADYRGYDPTDADYQGYTANRAGYTGYDAVTAGSQGYDAAQTSVDEKNDLVRAQLEKLLNDPNSILNVQSNTEGMRQANARGLLNSSMAVSAAQDAAYKNATPIAAQDAGTYVGTRLANQSATNQSRAFTADAANRAALANAQFQNAAAAFNAGAYNDSERFNAAAENQADQFSAGAYNDTSRFNAASRNTADQFNAGAYNDTSRFNASTRNAADQFAAGAFNDTSRFNATSRNATNQFNANLSNNRDQFNAETINQAGQRFVDSFNNAFLAGKAQDYNAWALSQQIQATAGNLDRQLAAAQAAARASGDQAFQQTLMQIANQGQTLVNNLMYDNSGRFNDQIIKDADGNPLTYTGPDGNPIQLTDRQLAVINAQNSNAALYESLGALHSVPGLSNLFPSTKTGSIGYAKPAATPVATPAANQSGSGSQSGAAVQSPNRTPTPRTDPDPQSNGGGFM